MPTDTAIALQLTSPVDLEGFPPSAAWDVAPPITFDSDWQAKNSDPQRQTEVRLLWISETLFLRFRCFFRTLTVFPSDDLAAEPSGRRWQLWDRDVAEVFLQPNPSEPHRYFEFEVSPNGLWIDLDIRPDEKLDPHSGLKVRTGHGVCKKIWLAELAIPMRALTPSFDPASSWRANFFRCEGPCEPRFYSAWRPTHTPQPNFHVPEAFGTFCFR
jgi:alpha-galactosidase